MVNRPMIAAGLLFFCLFMMPYAAIADSLTATLDRNQMHIGESVQLTLTLQGSADGEPDLSPLTQQFEIIDQSKSSNIQIINGSMSRSSQWAITLMPRQTGVLSIPPLRAGNLLSARQSIEVLPEDTQATANGVAEDVILDVTVQPQDAYVQQQILCTVRLFRAIDLAQAQLTEPDVAKATVQRLGEDATYKTQRQGRSYIVTERRYAIFPQQHGELTIPELHFSGRAATAVGLFMQAGRVIRKNSEPVALHVHPIPANWPSNAEWLPSSNLQIREDAWGNTSFHVGDAITRTITLEAEGLTAAQLPPLPAMELPAGFRQYPDQPILNNSQQAAGITGSRQEKTAIMATQAGSFTLPEIRIPWWNTQTQRMEYATLPARSVTILPAEGAANAATAPATTVAEASAPAPAQLNAADKSSGVATASWQGWPLLAVFSTTGWLITLLWLAYRHKGRNGDKTRTGKADHSDGNEKQCRNQAIEACRQHQADAAYPALLRWGTAYSGQVISNLTQLTAVLADSDDEWADPLMELDRYRYSRSPVAWNGTTLAQLLAQQVAAPRTKSTSKNGLPVLE